MSDPAGDVTTISAGDVTIAVAPLKTYTCPAGHSMRVRAHFFCMLMASDDSGERYYNYCPHCFGEWAVKQWPLTEQAAPAPEPDAPGEKPIHI